MKVFKAKYFIIILFFFSPSLLSQQVYKDENYGFQIVFPNAWKIEAGTGSIPIIASSEDNLSLNVTVFSSNSFKGYIIEESKIDTFKLEAEKGISGFKGYKLHDYGLTTIASIPSFFINYSRDGQKGTMWFIQYIFFNDINRYGITVSCLEKDNELYGPVLRDIASSFSFP
jgi:hypothetical protein